MKYLLRAEKNWKQRMDIYAAHDGGILGSVSAARNAVESAEITAEKFQLNKEK